MEGVRNDKTVPVGRRAAEFSTTPPPEAQMRPHFHQRVGQALQRTLTHGRNQHMPHNQGNQAFHSTSGNFTNALSQNNSSTPSNPINRFQRTSLVGHAVRSLSANTVRVTPQTRHVHQSSASTEVHTTPQSHQAFMSNPSDVDHTSTVAGSPPSVQSTDAYHSSTDLHSFQPSVQNSLLVSGEAVAQRGPASLQSTQTPSQSSSSSSSVFMALMNQSVPCVIGRNEDGYFVIGPLKPKENGPQQMSETREPSLPSSSYLLDSASTTVTETSARLSTTSTGKHGNLASAEDTATVTPGLHSDNSPALSSTSTVVQGFGARRDAPDRLNRPSLPQTYTRTRSRPGVCGSSSTNLGKNARAQSQGGCQAIKRPRKDANSEGCSVSAEGSHRHRSVFTSVGNEEDSDIIFVSEHFKTSPKSNRVSTAASSTIESLPQFSIAVKTQTGGTASVTSSVTDVQGSDNSCVIVLSEDENDVVFLGTQPQLATSASASSTTTCSSDQQPFTAFDNQQASSPETFQSATAVPASSHVKQLMSTDTDADQNVGMFSQGISSVNNTGALAENIFEPVQQWAHDQTAKLHVSSDAASEPDKNQDVFSDRVGEGYDSAACIRKESQSAAVPDAPEPICKVVSIMSLRMDLDDSQTTVAWPFHQLSAEAFYRCGCAGGTCSFQSLLPAQLLMHLVEAHNSEASFPCVHCGSRLHSCDGLLQHIDQHLDVGTLSLYCSDTSCEFHSSSPGIVLCHMAANHPNVTCHTCWRCSTTFRSLLDFKVHISQNMIQIVLCPHCSAKHTDRRCILNHIMTSHLDKGRVVAFHEMLLCQERALTNWFEPSSITEALDESFPGGRSICDSSLVQSDTSRCPEKWSNQTPLLITEEGALGGISAGRDMPVLPAKEEIKLSWSEESDSDRTDDEDPKLAKLRAQWSNESLTNGPVIEIDRAESPTDLDIWDCYEGSSSSPYSGARSCSWQQSINRGSRKGSGNTRAPLQTKKPIEAAASCETSFEELLHHKLQAAASCASSGRAPSKKDSHLSDIPQGSGQKYSGGSDMPVPLGSRKRNLHQSEIPLPVPQTSGQQKGPVGRSCPRDYFTVNKKGSVTMFKCLHCPYAADTKSRPYSCAYARLYVHVQKMHMPDTFQCPFCSFQHIFRNFVVRHIRKNHPEELSGDSIQIVRSRRVTPVPPSPQKQSQPAALQRCKPEVLQRRRHKTKSSTPRDFYSVERRGGSKVMRCLCCSYTVSGSKGSSMIMHVWQHMERYKCAYCNFKGYPVFNVRKHIQRCHPGEIVHVMDTEMEVQTANV
ncbi:hypothetical protein BaRGS_00008107 [Batillaria attramentaria]|uniref:C2H2-type domain-containing protein n=1 Tax=Batillaria attramentaria TaxID=370345 RepID=A0ABD0LNA7_9CAEN